MRRVFSTCIALWVCGAVGGSVQAQAIDPSTAHVTLHQPFALDLLVRGDALAASRSKHCLSGDFQSGSHHLPADEVQLSLAPSERPGWYRARFQHTHVVADPSLVARIVVRCPALYERELVLQALPASTEAVIMTSAMQPMDAKNLPVAPAGRHKSRSSARPSQREKQKHTAEAQTWPSKPNRLPEQQAPYSATAQQFKREVERLQQELSRERAEITRLKNQAAPALEHQPAPAIAIAWHPAAWAGLALPLIGLIPLLKRRRAAAAKRIHTMEIALPLERAAAPAPETPPRPPLEPEDPASPRRPGEEPCATSQAPVQPMHNHDLIPATVVTPGAASLEDREAAVFTCQVDQLVGNGYIGVAVDLLEKSLHAGVAKNPWLLLQLLALRQRLGHLSEAAQTISLTQTLYRVSLPTLGGLTMEGQDLLTQPRLLDEITLAWHSPQASAVLEDLIFGAPGPSWDLATFNDLLLLHAIAQNRTADTPLSQDNAATRHFEPVLEWSVDD